MFEILFVKNKIIPSPLVVVSTSKIVWRHHFMKSHRAYYH